jgi:putative SOS response-associated peptidase YedK
VSNYFIEDETEKVTFEDGMWVEIKTELTQEDQDIITSAMIKMRDNKDIEMVVGRLILLERMAVRWSFPLPLNKSNLSKLRRKYREPVLQRIDALNSQAFEYIAKNSTGASSESQPSAS